MLAGIAVAIAVTVLFATAGAAFAHDDGHERETGVYLALGDSLAVGTGARNEQHLGYVAHVFRYARPASRGEVNELTNLAVGGETSGTLISGGQLAAAVAAIQDPETDTRIVTLSIGGNDLPDVDAEPCASDPLGVACQGLVAQSLTEFAANYATILGTLQAALAADPGDERLIVMTAYNPFSGTGSPFEAPVEGVLLGADGGIDCAANATDPRLAGLNDLITCIGAGAGATIADVYSAFDGRGLELTHIADGDVHPNNFGHRVIAGTHVRSVGD
jgi:lysophospholipase L1-like esterase